MDTLVWKEGPEMFALDLEKESLGLGKGKETTPPD